MTDIPIIFSAGMVRALLDGRKSMTRRLAWRSETDTKKMSFICDGEKPDPLSRPAKGMGVQLAGQYWLRPTNWGRVKPGDRLWVRENFKTSFTLDKKSMRDIAREAVDAGYRRSWCPIKYEADGATDWGNFGKVRPCIFMPRWASRLTLIVTATKIERLNDISLIDIRDEGCKPLKSEWAMLWDSIHGDGAYALNPEVVALTFTVHKQNIDALPKAEAA